MKKINIIFFGLLLILFACTNVNKNEIAYDKVIYEPSFSSNFIIEGKDSSNNVLITIYNPWQGSKDIITRLFIAKDSILPDDFEGQVIKGIPSRIVCMSSTHVAMLDALDALNTIVGLSGAEYVSNPKLISSSRLIPDIGYEGNIDYEALIAANPDLVLLFSINGASMMEPKLKELKIPFIYIGDYVEEDPLGKTEWIVPIAEILGKREEGIELFNKICEKYINLKSLVQQNILERPSVMVNAPFLDSWFMPSTESYVARMIGDAGGEYIYKKNTGNSSEPIEIEEALDLLSKSDYWINIGTLRTLEELKFTLPKFSKIRCVADGNIYNNNLRSTIGGGNDCYESGVVNPDIVLRDMIKIFHPSLINEDFYYYHQLK